MDTHPSTTTARIIADLQSSGIRLADPRAGVRSRRGGAGPSDHKAVTIDGITVMVPVHTASAFGSAFTARAPDAGGVAELLREDTVVGQISFPPEPRFYGLSTKDGIPYAQIATLHGRDVLATTILQNCIRYQSRTKSCQFCAIGQSLAAGRTIAHKTPAQLAEVAKAAVELDSVRHMVMTKGTPNTTDRGAAVLCESAAAVKAAIPLAIQGQCEPPDDDALFTRMRDSGIDTLGMHIEVVTNELRQRIMPGKASVPVERYLSAFAAAVPVFGRGKVSTYILAGLGDSRETLIDMAARLVAIGIYPFIVPFVPISGTPLEDHPSPTPAFMASVLEPVAAMLREGGLAAEDVKAGCARCGACSSLLTFEKLGRDRREAA